MTPKEKAQDIYHECLNCGKGYISDYLAGKFAMIVVEELIQQDETEFFTKVKKELKKILNLK